MKDCSSAFIDLLSKPIHSKRPTNRKKIKPKDGEIYLSAVNLTLNFADNEGLLDTAIEDFKRFLFVSEIEESETGLPFTLEIRCGFLPEEYLITVEQERITLTASDTEGLRRGLIFIEDEMNRRSGSYLPLGVIRRKPFIKKRISRCYFTPPSHASNEGLENELATDIDYYPDEYLNRLAHDGVNALWLGASFRDLLKSDIITEYGKDSERRLKKLNEVVEKCRRYGIGIYLFSVEPASIYNNPDLEKHPELLGGYGWGGTNRMFCISTNEGESYLRESVKKLFTEVPNLAGFIGITTGECLSACGSDVSFNCPRCSKKYGSHAATLAATERIIAETMSEVNPKAEFISWTYSQRAWSNDEVTESCELRDKRIIHMQNFEDLGKPIQLGEERLAIDYWLSYVGPGEVMERTIAINSQRKIRTFAKIQACSSHEISTVPYVPAPGILYDKFSYMREHGIEGVMLCWYFGNYPCIMNKAACELSFEPYLTTKIDFLRHISGIYSACDAEILAEAFAKIEEGYKNYPVSVSFEWYGPMQDSPAAPLHLIPKDIPMPATWLCTDTLGGDRIGEALLDGHTLDEALTLSRIMCTSCEEAASIINTVSDDSDDFRDIKSVANALAVIFKSGYNVLKFYSLRHELALSANKCDKILCEMQDIVNEEIKNSEDLVKLCKIDIRLGYHSEAHGYKFSVQSLKARVVSLKELLDTEFPLIRDRINRGLPPLSFYLGEDKTKRLIINSDKEFEFSGEPAHTRVSAKENDGKITLRFTLEDDDNDTLVIMPEFHLFHPSAPFTLKHGEIYYPDNNNYSFFGKRAAKRRNSLQCSYKKAGSRSIYEISFKRCDLGVRPNEPIRIAVLRKGRHNEKLLKSDKSTSRLIFGNTCPSDYLFIVQNNKI